METDIPKDLQNQCWGKIKAYLELFQKKGWSLIASQAFSGGGGIGDLHKISFTFTLKKEGEEPISITKNTHDFIVDMLRELEGKVSEDEENRYRENC